MGKLLSFELRKLFKTKGFYIWAFASVAVSVFYLLCTFLFSKVEGAGTFVSGETGIISVINFFSKSPVTVFMLMFIAGFVCNDFENGILKNIISRGYSRGSIFTAKFIAVMIASTFIVVLNMAAVFCMSTLLFNNVGTMYSLFIPQLILLVLGLLAFAGIFFMLCVIFKKNAPAIVIALLLILVLPTGISMLSSVMHLNFDIGKLWLGNVITGLVGSAPTMQIIAVSGICIVAYLIVSYIVSVSMVKKMEV